MSTPATTQTHGSKARAGAYPACESWYAVITDAGIRPRSLTVNPLCRAHERTSALLVERRPAGRLSRGVLRLAGAPVRATVAFLFSAGVFLVAAGVCAFSA